MKGTKLDKNLRIPAKLRKKKRKRKKGIKHQAKPIQSKYPFTFVCFVTLSFFYDSFVTK